MIQPHFLTIGAFVRNDEGRLTWVTALTETEITCVSGPNGQTKVYKPEQISPWELTAGFLTNLGFEFVEPRQDWCENFVFVYQLRNWQRSIRISQRKGEPTIHAFTDYISFPVFTVHQLQALFQQFEGITLRLVQ